MALPAWARSRRLILAVGAVVYLAAAVSLLILLPISTSDGTGDGSTGGGGWDAAARSIIGRLPWASRARASSSDSSYGGAPPLQATRPGGAGTTRTDPRNVKPATEPGTEEANSAYAVGTILTMLAADSTALRVARAAYDAWLTARLALPRCHEAVSSAGGHRQRRRRMPDGDDRAQRVGLLQDGLPGLQRRGQEPGMDPGGRPRAVGDQYAPAERSGGYQPVVLRATHAPPSPNARLPARPQTCAWTCTATRPRCTRARATAMRTSSGARCRTASSRRCSGQTCA